jgi:hypothetical protein
VSSAKHAVRPHNARTIWFYTQCRHWHGYLSAFAFLALMFFSATGIMLNHPDWFSDETAEPVSAGAQVSAGDLAAAKASRDPGAALALALENKAAILGAYASGDVDPRQAVLRFEGVKGATDATVDMKTGHADLRIRKADAVSMLDDLHRGKGAGKAWGWLIDMTGVLLLVLSLIGYVLFFTMRSRLRTALVLTGLSVAALAGLFVFFVP